MSLNTQDLDPEAPALSDSNDGDWISLNSMGSQISDDDTLSLPNYPNLPSVLPDETIAAGLARHERHASNGYRFERKHSKTQWPPLDYKINIHNDIRSLRDRRDTRLHEAVLAQDLVAIQHLLNSGVSPALLNLAGLTPLHLCITRKLVKPFEALLRYPESVNVKDAGGLSVLHVAVLHQWLPGVEAALKAGADVTALFKANTNTISQTPRRYPTVVKEDFNVAIKQTPIHLATKGDIIILAKILEVGKKEFLNCGNIEGETPLYTAIMNDNLEAVKMLLENGASAENISKRKESALHIAVSKPVILKYVLRMPHISNLNNFSDYGLKPLHEAVFCNQTDSVKLLLKRFNEVAVSTIRTDKSIENKNDQLMPLHLAVKSCNNETAEVLLELGANANAIDGYGNTPLHIAANAMNRGACALLLRHGALLSAEDNDKKSALQLIESKFYDALSFFESLFDDFICYNEIESIKTSAVHVNYEVISSNNDSNQIKTIEEFVRCGLRKLLLHPFVESLLYLKWRQYLPIFYALIIKYMIFLACFYIFTINYFFSEDYLIRNNITSLSSNITNRKGELPLFEMYDKYYYILLALIYSSLTLLVLQELFYIYLKKKRYFFTLESWLKLAGLVLAAGLPLAVHFRISTAWHRHIACTALLLIWIQAMILLSRFPGWGYYVLMLGKVSINMFKVFATSIGLVIGFAFCFMIEFKSQDPFNGQTSAIIKTFIMMTSEFEYETLFEKQHHLPDSIALLLFVIFVIFVPIVLMNFMVAVAVSDINALNIAGNINRLEKQVDLLSSLNVLVNIGPLAKNFNKKYGGDTYPRGMYNSIKENKTWLVQCSSYSDVVCPHVFPLTLHKAILEKAREKNKLKNKKDYKNATLNKLNSIEDALIGKNIETIYNYQENGTDSYSTGDIIRKLNEKTNQLTSDMAFVKDMLADIIAVGITQEKKDSFSEKNN